MVRAIMHGCNGHMGQVITQLVREDDGIEIVAGIDLADNRDNGYPVYTDIWACQEEAVPQVIAITATAPADNVRSDRYG